MVWANCTILDVFINLMDSLSVHRHGDLMLIPMLFYWLGFPPCLPSEPPTAMGINVCAGCACGVSASQRGHNLAIQTHLTLWQMDTFTLTNSFIGFPSFMPLLTWIFFLQKLSPTSFLWLSSLFVLIFQKPDPDHLSLQLSGGYSNFSGVYWCQHSFDIHYLLSNIVRCILMLNINIFFS